MRWSATILFMFFGLLLQPYDNVFAQKIISKKYVFPADTVLKKVNPRPIARKIYKPKPLLKEMSLGVSLSSLGNGIGFRKYKTDEEFNIYRGFYIHLGHIKSNKEVKIAGVKNASDPSIATSSFTYGKINNLLNLQLGYSVRKKISGYLENTNVVIYGFGDAGINLGFLKPYYLKLARTNASGSFFASDEKYSDSTALQFLDKRYVYAKSPFAIGLGESKLQIGANVKAGFQFDYAPAKESGVLVEVGAMADVFTKENIILIGEKAKQFYPAAFVSVKYSIKTY
jgi:hypothetical protein